MSRHLLTLDLGGYTLRLSDDPTTVDGDVYGPGLDVGSVGRIVDRVGITIDGWEPTPDGWGAWISDVGPLEQRAARLYWHRDGETLEQARLLIDGVAVDVQYGGPGEALDFELQRQTGDMELMPSPTAVITEEDWSTAADSAIGKWPAIIFGYPGSTGTGPVLPCVPVLYVSVGGTEFLAVANGSIAGTTCTVFRAVGTGGYTIWSNAAISEQTKSGRIVSVIQGVSGAPASFHTEDGSYYLGFTDTNANHGGVANWDGSVRRGAADVLLWCLEQYSTAAVDRGRWNAVAGWLNAYQIDAYVNAPISPLEWIGRAVLPYLPVRLRQGRSGLWLQPHRYAAVAADAVRELSADRGDVRRSGRVGVRDPVYTRFSISYRLGVSGYMAQRALGPLPGVLNVSPYGYDEKEYGRGDLRLSEGRFGQRTADHIECPITWDHATAARVLNDQADRYGWPKRAIQYVGPMELEHIDPGQVIMLTDSELGIASALALVEEVTVSLDEVALDLTVLDGPP